VLYNIRLSIVAGAIVDKAFEVIDHTADIGIIAYGTDIKQVFTNAALGMFHLITDIDDIGEDTRRDIELSSQDTENLLVEWLNELLYAFDAEHIVFKSFWIDTLSDNHLKATCRGTQIDPGQYRIKREVKAATYHMLDINKEDSGYKAQIIFDI
jgi:SHS2 domain-containing protein